MNSIIKLLKKWLFSIIGLSNGKNKLLKLLRFTIGEQYENYEFHLKSQGNIKLNGITYEMCLYEKGNFKYLLGLPISRGILMLYNVDTLSAVYYRFTGNQFDYLLGEIDNYLPSDNKMTVDPFINKQEADCKITDNIFLELLVKKDGNTRICLMSKDFKMNSIKSQNKNLGQT